MQGNREPGRAFYDAVANVIGLVNLLNDHTTSEPDLQNVRMYLTVQAGKLDELVKEIRITKVEPICIGDLL